MSASPTPTPSSTDLVSLKLTHQGLTRRLSISAHPTPTWAALATEVQSRFGLADEAKANLGLSYVDEDGDAIILSSDQELAELWTALVSEESFTQPKFTVVDLNTNGDAAKADNKSAGTDAHLTELLSQVRLAVEADPTVAMQLRGVVHEAFGGQHLGPNFGPARHPHHFHGHPHHFGMRGPGPHHPAHADLKAAHQQAREARHLARAARRLAREERRTARNSSDSSLSASEDSSTSDSSSDSEDDRRKGKGKGRGHHYGRHHDLFGPEAGLFGLGHRFGSSGLGHKGFGGRKHGGPNRHHFGGPGGPPGAFPPGPGGPPPPPHAFGSEMPAFGPGRFERGPHHFGKHHHVAAGFGGGRGGFGRFGGRGGFGGGTHGRHAHFAGAHPGAGAGPSGLHHHMPPPPPFPHPDDIEIEVEGYVVPPAFEKGDQDRRHRKGGRHGKHDRGHAHGKGGRKDKGDKDKGERA